MARITELHAVGKSDARKNLESQLSFAPAAIDSVINDVIDGSSVGVSATGGATATRVFYVDGLAGPPAQVLWQALGDPRIPQVGNFHPYLTNLPVSSVRADLIDGFGDAAKVVVQYGFQSGSGGGGGFDQDPDDPEALPSIEVGSSVQGSVTEFDRFGKPIQVTYDVPPPEGEAGPPAPVTKTVAVEYQAPLDVVTFRRRERRSPGLASPFFKGHVNATEIFGDEPRTWLCTMFDGVSDDGGATYNVTYQFQRSLNSTKSSAPVLLSGGNILPPNRTVQGWDTVVAFKDSDGNIPDDVIVGRGIKLVEVYPERNFQFIPGLPFGRERTRGGRP